MTLNNIIWTSETYREFLNYLQSKINTAEKVKRRETIINTSLKVLAIYNKDIMNLTKELRQSDFKEYLDITSLNYYEETMLFGNLLPYLDNFLEIEKYLKKLSLITDNWATCDNIPFKLIVKNYEDELFTLSNEYIKSDLPFERRIGLKILFEYINKENYNDLIFKMLDQFKDEEHYYVNMIIGWLLCELFIKNKKMTYEYLNGSNKVNKAAMSIFIRKARDSFRVLDIDKELVLKYKE